LGYSYLQNYAHMTKVNSAMTIGVICIGIALFSLSKLHETWGRDLDYEEV